MTVECKVIPQAEVDLYERDLWWSINRPDSHVDVIEAFYATVAKLGEHPSKGVGDEELPDVRWIPIKDTPYQIYYRYIPGDISLEVLAVWSSEQDGKPPQIQ